MNSITACLYSGIGKISEIKSRAHFGIVMKSVYALPQRFMHLKKAGSFALGICLDVLPGLVYIAPTARFILMVERLAYGFSLNTVTKFTPDSNRNQTAFHSRRFS